LGVEWGRLPLSSWGRTCSAVSGAFEPQTVEQTIEAFGLTAGHSVLAYGAGRSYGDACLNGQGLTMLMGRLNRVHSFDPGIGEIVCEAGVTFGDLLDSYLYQGFIVPVTPGTGFVTIGGAVANDVHGKNHDREGSFGDHVRWIDLLLPTQEVVRVSPSANPNLFAATIAGIGLTGIILRVCFRMRRVSANVVELREERVSNLGEFIDRFQEVRDRAHYSVGWIDALARGVDMGRGILETAEVASRDHPSFTRASLSVPVDMPSWLLSSRSVQLFNALYYHRVPRGGRTRTMGFRQFLYPLDAISNWNRLYGKRGFYQFQCVLPDDAAREGLRDLLEEISRSRAASFLAVIKTLGGAGRGYLSFPMRGFTLALDFQRNRDSVELLRRLEAITLHHGGRLYLAKDACLSREAFEKMFPRLPDFQRALAQADPDGRMRSDMARRLGIC